MQRSQTQSQATDPPAVSRFLYRGFARHARRLLLKNFQAIRIAGHALPEFRDEAPVLVYGNHAGWWDPLVAVTLHEILFPGRRFYAPMDAAALRRYPLLDRLGFFGVEQNSARGMRQFLRTARGILDHGQAVLYITPQGRFADVRARLPFKPGLSQLVASLEQGTILPMALEYTFWNESSPEVLVETGTPIRRERTELRSRADWNEFLEAELYRIQDSLAEKGISRTPERFRTLPGGRAGAGGLYELFRRWKARLTGQPFQPTHGVPEPSQEIPR